MKKFQSFKARNDYPLITIVSLLIVSIVMELWNVDLAIPFEYSTDSLVYSSWIKGIIENGWWLENKSLSAPFVQTLHDFPYPATATIQILILKIIGSLTGNTWLTLNLYFLLTFPLITLTSLLCLREFGISRYVSIAGSLLFAFIPFHFFRGVGHLFSSGYYIVPLVVMLALWIYQEEHIFFSLSGNSSDPVTIFNRKFVLAFIITILISNIDIHFAFFGSFLLLVAGLSGTIARKSRYPLINSMILLTVLTINVLATLSPTIISNMANGHNLAAATRSPAEADQYGLKIIQLLLPVDEHRVPLLGRITDRYYLDMGYMNESSHVTLGAIASFGFVFLLCWLFWGRGCFTKDGPIRDSLDILSILNGSALLLGTVGGFGMMFALFISPQIRVYNRICIYIAFVSLFAVCILADYLIKRFEVKGKSSSWVIPIVCVFIFLGIFDQTTRNFIPKYEINAKSFNNDGKYIAQIEATLPPGSMIFQLPYIPFPENGPVHKMTDYEHMKAYLHSKNLRWTYGAVKGRKADRWQQKEADKPAAEFVREVAIAGFSGIYLDRRGYEDDGKKLVSEIAGILKTAPSEDPLGNYVFFSLLGYKNSLINNYSAQQLQEMKTSVMSVISVDWRLGCYDLEHDSTRTWRWCSADAVMELTNAENVARKVKLNMTFFSNYEETAKLKIDGGLLQAELPITAKGTPYSATVSVPPGKHTIHFSTDAKKVNAQPDPRDMYFHIDNFKLE